MDEELQSLGWLDPILLVTPVMCILGPAMPLSTVPISVQSDYCNDETQSQKGVQLILKVFDRTSRAMRYQW